ncbi:hypothetical protein RMSM_02237 [Rhodopirellula maiorica SM1]|uniref:Uncharacterized protein n=1 Tax=Rhodopirellula maiorica SM1 TaxID=1265738 RepID=M5RNR4_9BACT|nr:hypothetical protein RMSM_02237 [Rhodopirellula maiorica SM1]
MRLRIARTGAANSVRANKAADFNTFISMGSLGSVEKQWSLYRGLPHGPRDDPTNR